MVCLDPEAENVWIYVMDRSRGEHYLSVRQFGTRGFVELERRLLPDYIQYKPANHPVRVDGTVRGRDCICRLNSLRANFGVETKIYLCRANVPPVQLVLSEYPNDFSPAYFARPVFPGETDGDVAWWIKTHSCHYALDATGKVLKVLDVSISCSGWLDSQRVLLFNQTLVKPYACCHRESTFIPRIGKDEFNRAEGGFLLRSGSDEFIEAHVIERCRFAVLTAKGSLLIYRCPQDQGLTAERQVDLGEIGWVPSVFPIASNRAVVQFVSNSEVVSCTERPALLLNLDSGLAEAVESFAPKWEEQGHYARFSRNGVGWRWLADWSDDNPFERHLVVRYEFDRQLALQERATLAYALAVSSTLPDHLRPFFACAVSLANPAPDFGSFSDN